MPERQKKHLSKGSLEMRCSNWGGQRDRAEPQQGKKKMNFENKRLKGRRVN